MSLFSVACTVWQRWLDIMPGLIPFLLLSPACQAAGPPLWAHHGQEPLDQLVRDPRNWAISGLWFQDCHLKSLFTDLGTKPFRIQFHFKGLHSQRPGVGQSHKVKLRLSGAQDNPGRHPRGLKRHLKKNLPESWSTCI